MNCSDIWNNINGSIGALTGLVAVIVAIMQLPKIKKSLAKFENENYWNDDAQMKFAELSSRLSNESTEKWGPIEWTGGTDFDFLLEFRNDDNMITKEMRKNGIKKSVRYVYRDEKGKMWVKCWYIK